MSDATAFAAAPQSASQLSENIGDVLASIRRLIAQEDAAEAGTLTPLAPRRTDGAPAREGFGGASDTPAESGARRRDILAEAQALTRRSEAAFGQPAEASSLNLSDAERMASFRATLPGRAVPAGDAWRRDDRAGPLVLTAPLPLAAPALWPTAGTATLAELSAVSTPLLAAQAPSAGEAGATKVPAVSLAADSTSHVAAQEQVPTRASSVQPLEQPAVHAMPPAPPPPVAPRPTPPEEAMPAAPESAAPAAAVEAVAEDCVATILRDMIREVVRQELHGDPAGRMPGDLRSMIMREVAQVLTQGARGAR